MFQINSQSQNKYQPKGYQAKIIDNGPIDI